MTPHDDFRMDFRNEMDAFRDAFRSKEFSDFEIERYRNARRENRDEGYHEKEVEFHSDSRTERTDESKIASYDNEEGGNEV
jgi:glycyl-tRNA synthetase (class II)